MYVDHRVTVKVAFNFVVCIKCIKAIIAHRIKFIK